MLTAAMKLIGWGYRPIPDQYLWDNQCHVKALENGRIQNGED